MADILETITSGVKGIFEGLSKSAESAVGIDIGSSSIKVVQLKKERGKIVLHTYGAVATGPYDEKVSGEMPNLSTEKITLALQDVIREANVTTASASLSIQASASLLFTLDLPQLSDRELEAVIPNEARKYIPVPLTEVSLDWWPIPEQEYIETEEQKAGRQALVVAIRKETIGQYNDLISALSFQGSSLEVEVFSAIRSTFHHELKPVILVDFGASSTRVAVVEYGIVKTFHTINRGSQYISQSLATSLGLSFEEAEKIKKTSGLNGVGNEDAGKVINTAVTYIFSEINSVLLQYEKEYHRTIGKMILVGGGSRLNGFHERASREFQFDVVYGDPFSKAGSPQFLQNVLRESGPEFANAVGLALKKLQ